MRGPENPHWKAEVQAATPHWRSRHPLTLSQILESPIYDTDGRNSLERTDENLVGVPMQYVDFHYAGREGLVGLAPAIGAFRRRNDAILQTIADFRSVFFSEGVSSLDRILPVVNAAIMFPNFSLHRSDDPLANGEISPEITGIKKAMRGIAIPLFAVQESKILDDYEGTQRDYDVSFLDSPERFLAYVQENGMLRSEKFAGVGCPADEPDILATLHALLDVPRDTKEVAQQRLGLTDDEVQRLKHLGLAFMITILEEGAWNATEFVISPEEHIIFEAAGRADPITFPGIHDRMNEVIQRLNFAQQLANQALRRNVPPMITAADLEQPRFFVEEF